jgi:iron complex transport system permease protein
MAMMRTEKTNRRLRYSITLTVLVILFVALVLLNIGLGSVVVPLKDIVKTVFSRNSGVTYDSIIWKIRLPRMTTAIILGGGLALSGFLLQTFFNNPIAGPYVLGISSARSLGWRSSWLQR